MPGSAGSETAPKAKVAKYFRLAEATSTTDAATMIGRVVRSGASQLVVGTTDDSVLTKFMADNQYTYDYVDHTADPFSDIKHVDSATLIATNVNADHAEMTGLTVFDMGSIVVEKDQLGNNKAIVRRYCLRRNRSRECFRQVSDVGRQDRYRFSGSVYR